MPAKDVKFSRGAREDISRGVDILADAVRVTLGPTGMLITTEAAIADLVEDQAASAG